MAHANVARVLFQNKFPPGQEYLRNPGPTNTHLLQLNRRSILRRWRTPQRPFATAAL